jgi:macrolide-specific efflux system membrane fusion protein
MEDPQKPKVNSNFKPYSALLLLVALAILTLFYWYKKHEIANTSEYLTAPITKGNVEDVVTAYGVIQPLDYVDIGAQVSGILKTLYVNYGDDVKKEQLLVQIDDEVYKSKVDGDKANIANLKGQFETKNAQLRLADLQNKRSQELFKEKAISQDLAQTSQSNYDQAVGNVASLVGQIDQAEATLRTDEANLNYTKILAPMNGTVINLIARQGQTLNANQSAPIILRLADLDRMTVWAQVSEADISKLKPGIPTYFNTLGLLDRRIESKIRIIYPTPEVITGAIFYDVLFDVENKDHSLLPQMSAQVFFVINEAKNVLLIPLVALSKSKPGRTYQVKVLNDQEVETREIQVGVIGRLNAEVISGLKEGELVVIGNKNNLSPALSPNRPPSPAIPGGR